MVLIAQARHSITIHMVRTVVAPGAVRYVQDRRKAGIVVYRDLLSRSNSSSHFIPKVKAAEREPAGAFVPAEGNDSGVPVWIERALLEQLEGHESLHISVDRGLIKRLKVELGSEQHGRRQQEERGKQQRLHHHSHQQQGRQRKTGAVGAA